MRGNKDRYQCSPDKKLMALARIFKNIATKDDNPELALIKSRYFKFKQFKKLLNLNSSDRQNTNRYKEDYNINDYCIASYDRLEGYTHHVTLLMTLVTYVPCLMHWTQMKY